MSITHRSELPPDNPHWNPVDDTQSYAFRIYRKIFDKLSTDPFFAGFVCKRTNKALPIEAGIQIPFLGVYLLPERMTPDGQGNLSNVRFGHNARVGIQVVIASNSQDAMEEDLDRIYWFILHNIFDDGDFTNFWRSNIDGTDNPRVESFPSITKATRWGSTGATNETPVGELQLELTMFWRTMWAPWDFPDLELVVLTTAFPPGGDMSQIHQVKIVAVFDPATGDYVPPPYDSSVLADGITTDAGIGIATDAGEVITTD